MSIQNYCMNSFRVYLNHETKAGEVSDDCIYRQTLLNYFKQLKESLGFANSLNYVNHSLYFSMIQQLKMRKSSGNLDSLLTSAIISKLNQHFLTNICKIRNNAAMCDFMEKMIEKMENSGSRGPAKKFNSMDVDNKDSKECSQTKISEKCKGKDVSMREMPVKLNEAKDSGYSPLSNFTEFSSTNDEKNKAKLIKTKKLKFFLKRDINNTNISLLNFNILPKRKIGKMEVSLRLKKILKYKLKSLKHRFNIPLVMKFPGRSKIAMKKARLRGRFVKQAKKIFAVKIC